MRRAEAEWTRKQASLNGLANCVAGGVFRCQLSCDSRQPSPSNHACGVPSSAGMGGWDRGCWERTRQAEVEGIAYSSRLSKEEGGPLRHQVPTHPLTLFQGCPSCPPQLLPIMCFTYTFAPFPFFMPQFKELSVLQFAKQLDWGCPWHGLADLQKVWDVRS